MRSAKFPPHETEIVGVHLWHSGGLLGLPHCFDTPKVRVMLPIISGDNSTFALQGPSLASISYLSCDT